MKAASPTLLALFASDQPFEQFDLYTITLISGFVMRYANCPYDVVYGGNTYKCARNGGVILDEMGDSSGPRAHWTSGFAAGSWEITVMPRPQDLIGALPWAPAVKAGILQEATVQVDRGYVAAWSTTPSLSLIPAGVVNVFFGRVAEIDFGRSSIQININDPRELLDIDMPRNVYTAQCRFALYSSQCTMIAANFAVPALVTAASPSTAVFNVDAVAQADNYFALGNCVFTSGQNAGLRLMPRSSVHGTGLISLIAPMPFPIAPGDGVTLYPGCDKTVSTCTNKFNNRNNHGGFTLIPAAETAV
jgi:hypothetical protein